MATTTKTIGSGGGFDYLTIQAFIDAVPDDAAVGDPWEGVLSKAEAYLGYTWNISNANNAPHKLRADSSVRYDGTGQRNGAYIESANTVNTITYSELGGIFLEDVLVIQPGGAMKATVFHSGTDSGLTLLRSTFINEGDGVNEWVLRFNSAHANMDIFLCQFFGGIRFGTSFDLGGVSNGRSYCNTWGQFDAVAENSGTKFLDDEWDVRGNLAIYKVDPDTSPSYHPVVGATGTSTKNAQDDTAYGTDPIDLTDDLGLDYTTLISRVVGGTINLLRTEADRAVAGQRIGQDLSSVIGNRDVTYTEFDSTDPMIGAHQLDAGKIQITPDLGLSIAEMFDASNSKMITLQKTDMTDVTGQDFSTTYVPVRKMRFNVDLGDGVKTYEAGNALASNITTVARRYLWRTNLAPTVINEVILV